MTAARALGTMLLWLTAGWGQVSPLVNSSRFPQAAAPEELEAVGEVYEASGAAETIAAALRVEREYPASEFLEYVRLARIEAHFERGEFEQAGVAARGVLEHNPESIAALISLADVESRRRSPEDSEAAVTGIHRALVLLGGLAMPQGSRNREWLAAKRELMGRAYAVLGYIELRGGRAEIALANLEKALGLDPKGLWAYRCGLAYRLLDRRAEAEDAFQRAVELGPDAVANAAREQLATLAKREGAP